MGWYHRLEHRYGWQGGRVITRLDGDELWIGFRCDTCGVESGWHRFRRECDEHLVGLLHRRRIVSAIVEEAATATRATVHPLKH